MEELKNTLKGIGLQFFAEAGAGDGGAAGGDEGGSAGGSGNGSEGQQGNISQNNGAQSQGKQYTQEQIKTMMANEKRTARQALLKELGFEVSDDKSYKDTVAGIKKTLDAGKTQQQLDQEARKNAETAQKDAENKAARLTMEVAALKAGVNPEYVEDVITLAQSRVTETETVDKVLEGFKTKYPNFFNESSKGSSGTGSSFNPARNKGGNAAESMGKRLAKSNKSANDKSSYFKHN